MTAVNSIFDVLTAQTASTINYIHGKPLQPNPAYSENAIPVLHPKQCILNTKVSFEPCRNYQQLILLLLANISMSIAFLTCYWLT